ncbi:Tetratricopeptide repeat (TPR)-like superfamily protein [Rhynchospora pubera]|uniref:Tetratricopeptide repeat (TPR)-like superfamily protein n=1 Tax=Rhynchospora pubera TaxID=906938 RepID=A0AAV8CM10_9POAL|nr:Tetratricopeptide repeat (TPR)-like superfamily protein [Rhynchospora pubera]
MIRRTTGITFSHWTLYFSRFTPHTNNSFNCLFTATSSSSSSSPTEDLSGFADIDFDASVHPQKQPDTSLSAKEFSFLQEGTSKTALPPESASFHFSPESVLVSKVVKANRGFTFNNKTLKILRQFRERLNDSVVIEVITLVQNPELCIKFFTWAARQIGYVPKGPAYDALIERLGFDEKTRVSHEFLKEIGNDDHEVLDKLLNMLVRNCCHNGAWSEALEELARLKEFGFRPTKVTYYALIQVLSSAGQLDMAFAVHAEMSNSGFFLDKFTMGCFTHDLCKAGRWVEALNLVEREDYKLDTVLCTNMISGLLEASLFEEAMSFLHRMRCNSCVPNVITYRTLLSGFLKKQQLGWCKRILNMMLNEGCSPNPGLFNSLMHAYCSSADYNYAYKLMQRMASYGCEPGYVIYNIFIGSICGSHGLPGPGLLDLSERAYDEMLEKGIVLNKINVVNFARCLCGAEKFEKAFGVIREIMKKGFIPDTSTYSHVIGFMCQSAKVEHALRLFDEMKQAGVSPDVYTYTILIDSFCKLGLTAQSRVWFDEMERNGCSPSVATYTSLIHAYLKSKQISEANLIFEGMLSRGCNPNVVTYTALIDGLCKAGETDKACQVYEKMFGNCDKGDVEFYFRGGNAESIEKIEPNVVTYGALVDGLCKAHKVTMARDLLNVMSSVGCEPNHMVYDALINGFCKADKLDDAHEVFVKMTQKGYLPNVYTYSTLIDKLFKDRRLDLALKVLAKMLESSCTPNVVTYTEMIDGLCKVGKTNEALKLFGMMQEKGCKPNVFTYTALIDGLGKAGKIDHGLKLFDEMQIKGCAPNSVTYRVLINHCCRFGLLDHAEQLLDEMKQTHWPRNVKAHKDVIHGFSKDFILSIGLVDEVVGSDSPPLAAAYGIVINSFCKAGRLDAALALYEEIKEAARLDFGTKRMYYSLIEALCLGFRVHKAFELYSDLIKLGQVPELGIFVCLVKGLVRVNLWDEALLLCYAVSAKGIILCEDKPFDGG